MRRIVLAFVGSLLAAATVNIGSAAACSPPDGDLTDLVTFQGVVTGVGPVSPAGESYLFAVDTPVDGVAAAVNLVIDRAAIDDGASCSLVSPEIEVGARYEVRAAANAGLTLYLNKFVGSYRLLELSEDLAISTRTVAEPSGGGWARWLLGGASALVVVGILVAAFKRRTPI
jgi:hypothetical protein